MPTPVLLVTFPLAPARRALVEATLDQAARTIYLADLADGARGPALRAATVVLAHDTGRELRPGEPALLAHARLIQFISAGVDFIPLSELPPTVPLAANGGAYAEAMAEHGLAMAFAAAKRLLIEHAALGRGAFNQFVPNRMLAGSVCGIFGMGGIGAAMARLARGIGMAVHAINRRGATTEPVEWIATPDRLDTLLAAADVLVIAAPLSHATLGRIGAAELARMKPDAILVNLARGEIVQEDALFAHLRTHPAFTACLDAWWVEPVRHGSFRMDHPFLGLPNVIGSPHNSAQGGNAGTLGLAHAVANVRRALLGQTPLHLITPEERMA
ncbi:MAG: NAD(P)-dependent oxidoreductase [Acetobacteraceae bacterium]